MSRSRSTCPASSSSWTRLWRSGDSGRRFEGRAMMGDRTHEVRVLVVEDAPEFRMLITRSLEADGFVVEAVDDGEHAIGRARTWGPDVIVLDLGLPKMGGLEVCRQVRTFSDAYVVMLTARSEEVD